MERELHYFVARVEECNVNSVKMFEKLGAKRMQTEESDVLKNLRELALVDKSLISVLVWKTFIIELSSMRLLLMKANALVASETYRIGVCFFNKCWRV